MAAAVPPRRIGRSTVHMDGGGADRPTPAIDGLGGTSSGAGAGQRPGIDLFSGPVCAAVFVSFAICIFLFCVYSFLARRRAVSTARQRVLRRICYLNLIPGWSTDVPVQPPPPVAMAPLVGVPPSPPLATTTPPVEVPPAPPPAPDRCEQEPNSNSGLGNCPVCLEPLHGRTNIMAAHACAHVFHASCIEPWLHNRGSCPVCRCIDSHTSIPIPDSTSTSNSSPIGDCPVCLEPLLVGGDDIRAAHACGHVFHSHCIEPWLHQRGSCPVCRCTTVNSTCTTTTTPTSAATSSTIGYCPVCLEPLHADSGDIRAAHVCGHVFHSRCIERWVRRRGSCPVCRCSVITNFNSTDNSTSNPTPISTSTPIPISTSVPTSSPTPISTSTPIPISTSNSNPVGECPVCLEPLRIGGGDVRAAHACGHVFHSRCIERWVRHRNSCPVCRCTVTCSRNP